MQVGMIGLGRMGAAIAQRLTERGCEVVAWDRNPKAREAQAKRGLRIVDNPRAVANALLGVHRSLIGYVRVRTLAGATASEVATEIRAQAEVAFERLEAGLGDYAVRR